MDPSKNSNVPTVNKDNEYEYDDVMTIIGFGKVHWWMLLTCGLLFMEVMSETMGMAIIAPASKCDFDTNSNERALLKSAAFMGIVCSSIFWGYFCDLNGRHKMLLLGVGITNCCSFISTFMPSYIPYVFMRFLTGIFAAVPSFVTLTYISEFCTNKRRQLVLNYMFMFNGFAMLYCPGLAAQILDYDWEVPLFGGFEYYSWNLLAQLYILPGVVGFLLLIKLPESPKFLISVGRHDDAFLVLDWLCRLNRGRPLHDFQVYSVKPPEYTGDTLNALQSHLSLVPHQLGPLMWNDVSPLFRKPFVHRFLLSCAIMFGLYMIANGMGIWFADMRNRNDKYDAFGTQIITTRTICDAMSKSELSEKENIIALPKFVCNDTFLTFRDSLILGVTTILLYQLLGLMLLFFKRKVIFIVPLLLSGACGITLTWLKHSGGIIVVFMLFLALPGAVVNLLGGSVVEFVPTFLRAKAVGFCMMTGRIGVICGANLIGNFLDHYCVLTFSSFALIALLCGCLGYFLPL